MIRRVKDFNNFVGDTFINKLANTPTRGNNIPDLVVPTDSDMTDPGDVGDALANSDYSIIRVQKETI